jgi:hypothetical protein
MTTVACSKNEEGYVRYEPCSGSFDVFNTLHKFNTLTLCTSIDDHFSMIKSSPYSSWRVGNYDEVMRPHHISCMNGNPCRGKQPVHTLFSRMRVTDNTILRDSQLEMIGKRQRLENEPVPMAQTDAYLASRFPHVQDNLIRLQSYGHEYELFNGT